MIAVGKKKGQTKLTVIKMLESEINVSHKQCDTMGRARGQQIEFQDH